MTDYDRTDEWNLDRGLPRRRPSGSASGASNGYGRETGRRSSYGNGYDSDEGYGYGSGDGHGYGSRPGLSQDDRRNARTAAAGKKRRKRRKKAIRVILTILLTALIIGLIGAAAYIVMQHLPKSHSDIYTSEIDITDCIAGNLSFYLADIEGTDIDAGWVRDNCGNIKVTSKLQLAKDENGNRTFSEQIDEDSYNEMKSEVDAITENIFAQIIAGKLVDAGYAETVSSEDAKDLAGKVLNMSIPEYMQQNGVTIVPSLDELNSSYTLGSGTYRTSGSTMNFNPEGADPFSEQIIKKSGSIVLVDSGKIYLKEENADE